MTCDDIKDKDYNLLPKRYVGEIYEKVDRLKEENRVVRLQEFLTRVKGRNPSAQELEKFADKVLKIQDLKRGSILC
ncbi:MAG: hypothetical protein U5J63_13225 [Fodinibius sp.]|nr:hypothetical protein [Fodinibius sp.]